MSDKVLAWHFCSEDRRLGYGDGRLIEVGKPLSVDCTPVLCEAGMHASIRALDALEYARGPVACRVVVEDDVTHDSDKLVGRTRTVVAMADATMLLHTFACDVAEEALRKYDPDPDPRSLRAIAVKRLWIQGQASDSDLAAARDAARAAAWAAARAAARDAAWAAAWAAARDAAWAAAKDAARAAAWAAARDAARAAARGAAWAPARDAENAALEGMLFELLGISEEVSA